MLNSIYWRIITLIDWMSRENNTSWLKITKMDLALPQEIDINIFVWCDVNKASCICFCANQTEKIPHNNQCVAYQ